VSVDRPRTVNRWTLEPVLFFLPFLAVVAAIALYAMVVALPVLGPVSGVPVLIVFTAIIVVMWVLFLRRKR